MGEIIFATVLFSLALLIYHVYGDYVSALTILAVVFFFYFLHLYIDFVVLGKDNGS